jgi:hypothetical protein
MRPTRRTLWTTLGVAVALGLLVSTGGFSSAVMDRGVAVSVAEHEDAVVSIWDPGGPSPEPPRPFAGENPVTPPTDRVTVLVLQHGVGRQVHVTVTAGPDSPVSVRGTVSNVRSGDVVPVVATVDCSDVTDRAPVTVPLRVHVATDDGSFESVIRYDARIVCAGAPGNATNATQSANASTANGMTRTANGTTTNASTATLPATAT